MKQEEMLPNATSLIEEGIGWLEQLAFETNDTKLALLAEKIEDNLDEAIKQVNFHQGSQ